MAGLTLTQIRTKLVKLQAAGCFQEVFDIRTAVGFAVHILVGTRYLDGNWSFSPHDQLTLANNGHFLDYPYIPYDFGPADDVARGLATVFSCAGLDRHEWQWVLHRLRVCAVGIGQVKAAFLGAFIDAALPAMPAKVQAEVVAGWLQRQAAGGG